MRAQVTFEQSLEHCLGELAHTGDVEAILQSYPQYADRLRPLLEMAQATRQHYKVVPQPPGGLSTGREWFLTAAAQQRKRVVTPAPVAKTLSRSRSPRLALSFRLAAIVLVAIFCLGAVGGGVAWAAQDSLPGDLLYPAKLATEDIRMALASGPGEQVRLSLQFVENRAEEIQELVTAGRPVPDDVAARMERHIENALNKTAQAAEGETLGLLAQVAERTRTQTQRLEQVQGQASQQVQVRLQNAVAVCLQGVEAAEAGIEDPLTFRWLYQHQEVKGDKEPKAPDGPAQEQNEHQNTPVGTPHRTPTPPGPQDAPQEPAVPAGPQVIPQGPQENGVPQGTSEGPRAIPGPKDEPQGPPATATPTLESPALAPAHLQEPTATAVDPTATAVDPTATGEPHQLPSRPREASGTPQVTPGP